MFPGLLLGLTLAAPPGPEMATPNPAAAHKDALAWYGAAVWNLRRDRLLTSARQLEDAARKDPDAAALQRELVRVYCQLGREPDAIRVARQLLKNDPNDFDTAHTLASLLFDAGKLSEAIAAAEAAAKCDIPLARAEKAVGVYRDLATLCDKANDLGTAELAMRRALDLVVTKRAEVIESRAFTPREADTAAAECHEKLGRILTRAAKYSDAAEAFATAAKLFADPNKANDPSAAMRLDWNLSGVLQAKGDFREALVHLNRVLVHRPLFPDPFVRLGQLYRALGRPADIVPELEDLRLGDPDNLSLRTVLATELARSPGELDRDRAEEMVRGVMAQTNDRHLVELIVRSRLSRRPGQLAADLDLLLAKIKEGDKDEPAADPAAVASAKAFAAEKARVIADVLRDDRAGTEAVLRAAADDLRIGTKHHHQTCFFLAQIAARNGKLSVAEHLLSQARRTAPPDSRADIYLALIQVLRLENKFADLNDLCNEASHDPRMTLASFIWHYHRATALAELGQAEKAVAAAEKAIQETGHSERLTVRLHKVHILATVEKWEDAIAYANKLFEEFPGRADRQEIRYMLAMVYTSAGKSERAEAELRAILDLDPDHAGACNDLGFELADRNRNLEEAERLIRHAIEVGRYDNRKAGTAELDNGMYLDSLGWVLFRKGDLAGARIELERAVALESGMRHAVIWDHLGDVYFRLGEKAKAKTAWEKAQELYEKVSLGPTHRYADLVDELKRKLKHLP